MRKPLAICLLLPVLAIAFAGCSSGKKLPTPAACQTTPEIWLTALASAPDQVLIEQGTPISDCLPPDQSAAQQEEVGRTAVEVATTLSASIKTKPGGGEFEAADQAALMAGYLVGALEKAADGTDGIHDTLVQRVEAAATNGLEGATQEVQGEYQAGYQAGLDKG